MKAEVNILTQNQIQLKQFKGPCWDHYFLISSLRTIGSGIDFTLSKFADDIKLLCAADILEGKYTTQGYLVRLEEGAFVNPMIFSITKSRIPRLNQGNPLKISSSHNHPMIL